jgi:hypothetical protein
MRSIVSALDANSAKDHIMQPDSAYRGFNTPRSGRIWVLIALSVLAIVGVMMHAPIAQPADYHAFADQRNIRGIPNFWNVISNLPFLIVGLMGTVEIVTRPALPLKTLYLTFFAGTCLVAFGSAYYHFAPSNQSLVWDRLPMAVVFMAFFSIIVADRINQRLGRAIFVPLLVLGIGSVVYWYWTEATGQGDLRPYVIAQFLPMVLIPLILLLFPARPSQSRLIWAVLGAYVLAKILELADEQLFALTAAISGHALKHVAAALGAYLFLLAVRRR